jgi:hypothetical protein
VRTSIAVEQSAGPRVKNLTPIPYSPNAAELLLPQTMSTSPFSAAHRQYVKSLYRRMLKNELDWIIRRDIWRAKAQEIRAEFERNRYAHCSFRNSTGISFAECVLSLLDLTVGMSMTRDH